MNKIKMWILCIICISILVCGVTKVSTEVLTKSETIRNNARFKILCSRNPFNFQIENNGYIFYINKKVVTNIRDKSNKIYNEFTDNFRSH